MRVAALDLGTNTFLLLIAEVESGVVTKVLHDEVRVVRLGQGVNLSRRLHPDALARAEECFSDFAKVISRYEVAKVQACATSAARDVSNQAEFIALGLRYGIPIEIISGEREADYTFQGTIESRSTADKESPSLIIDIGGGSTEFILGDSSGIRFRKSLDIGSVRLTEMFITEHPVPTRQMQDMVAYCQKCLSEARLLFPVLSVDKMIAVAGTPTTLATLDQGLPFESDRVHGYVLSIGRVRSWVQKLAAMTIEERQGLAGMEPKRADVLVAGATILMLAAQTFGVREYQVSVRGLRYGLAIALEGRGDV